jgi:hypothetical protein
MEKSKILNLSSTGLCESAFAIEGHGAVQRLVTFRKQGN